MSYRRRQNWIWIIALVLIIFGLAAITFINFRYSQTSPKNNDFLINWMGARNFLINGVSPYSEQSVQQIETFAYGHPARGDEVNLYSSMPLYSIILYLPFAIIPDYIIARAVWMTVLEVILVILAIFSIRLANWRPGIVTLIVFSLFAILGLYTISPLLDGNVIIVVTLAMMGGFLALRNEVDELAGFLFAFATIKPQISILLVLYVLIWGMVHKRWRLIGWLIGTFFLLVASAALLLPDWIMQYTRIFIQYSQYAPPESLQNILRIIFPAMGGRLGLFITGIVVAMLITEWWMSRGSGFAGFYWTACFTMVITQWIGVPTSPRNLIMLLPSLVLVYATWEMRWRRVGRILSILSILVLFASTWGLFLRTSADNMQNMPGPLLLLPLPAFLIITLYWIRWWAIHPPSVWFDWVYEQEHLQRR